MNERDVAAKVAKLAYYSDQPIDEDSRFALQLLVEHFCVPVDVTHYDPEELEAYILTKLKGD